MFHCKCFFHYSGSECPINMVHMQTCVENLYTYKKHGQIMEKIIISLVERGRYQTTLAQKAKLSV